MTVWASRSQFDSLETRLFQSTQATLVAVLQRVGVATTHILDKLGQIMFLYVVI